MAVRAITGGFDVGPRRLHRWLGVAVLLGAAVAWSEPMLAWWRADCGAAALPSMPWLAAPVVVAALLRVRWPLLAASLGWAGMVCATCWQLDGACAGALPTETAPEPIAAVSPEVPDAASLAPPRTDSGGRWPAPPSPSSVGVSLSKLADRMAAAAGGTGRAAPGSPAAVPGRSGGPSGAGPGSVPDASASGGSSDGAPVLPEGRGAAPSPSPAAPVVPQPGSGRPGEAVAEPPVPESPRRFAGPQSTRGGWVSADHRRTPRDHVRISVEHATRSPDDFFGEARRRVYIPSDRVFDPGTTRIRKKGELELARLANLMKLQPDRRGVLEVHTDASGSPADQEALSGRQAAAIHDWLASRGHLDPDRLELRGAGGSEPIVPPDGSHAAQKPNRRIEIHLID